MAWNPYERPSETTVALDVSEGAATITLRKWTGRERLAYEDIAGRIGFVAGTDPDTGEPAVETKVGTLRIICASLTIIAVDGFPPLPDGTAFDPANLEHYRNLDVATLEEMLDKAGAVQPIPGNEPDEDDEEAAEVDAVDPDLEGPDPTPASSSTSPASTATRRSRRADVA